MKTIKQDKGRWPSAADDPRLVTAGYIELTGIPGSVSGPRLDKLKELDTRLRCNQTIAQRLELYQEIIRRGDMGNGYAVKFTDEDQSLEYNCEEIAEEVRKRKEAEKKAADIEAHVKKAVDEAVAPIVETFKKAILVSTAPHERQWWQNLRAAYIRQSEPTDGMKWRAVAHIVVMGANLEIQKPARDRQSDYLTPRMLRTLVNKLKEPGANNAKFEDAYADTLRRYVTREEQKAKKPAKSRA